MMETISKIHIRGGIIPLLPGSVISGLVIYFILSEFLIPFRIIVPASVLISVLTFGLANYYRTYDNSKVDERSHNIVGKGAQKNKPLIIPIFIAGYVISIIFSSLAEPNSEIFIQWEHITLSQLVSLGAAVVISVFAPGYALISAIDRKSELSRLSRLLFAYLLSILVTGLFGYISSSHGIAISHANILFCIVNALILAIFVFVKILQWDSARSFCFPNAFHVYGLIKENISKIIIFASLFGLVVVSTYVLYNGTIVGDQWFHYGRTFMFLSGDFRDIAAAEIDVAYPPFLHAYLATFFALSSMPSVNSYVSINFLNIIPTFAFYYFFSKWVPCYRKTALLATSLFMLSSGFGWIYALNLAITYNDSLVSTAIETFEISWIKTYDIFTPNTFVDVTHPEITTGLIIIAIPAGFILLGFIKEGINNKLKYTVLIATVCILGLLTHEEFMLFIIIASFIPLIFRLNQSRSTYTFFGILLAILTVILITIFFPGAQHYYMTPREPLPPLIPLSFLFVSFMWILYATRIISGLYIPRTLWNVSKKVATPYTRRGIIFVVIIIAAVSYFYVLSFLIWDMLLPVFDVRFNTNTLGDVPWYFYPLRFGITGLLALSFVLSYIFKKYEREVFIFGVIAFIAFLTGFFYSEFRFNKYIMAGMAGLAALMLYQIISLIGERLGNFNNAIISGLLIGSIITCSSLSILMYTGYSSLIVDSPDQRNEETFNRRQFPSDSEMHLMDFLRNNLSIKNDNVAIPEREILFDQGLLSSKIQSFAGTLQTKLFQTPLILQEPTLSGFYRLLNHSNTKFVILPREYINDNTFMSPVLKFAITNFPKSYEDSSYVVLSVPDVAPPSVRAEIALVTPRIPDYSYYYTLSALALSKTSYDIYEQDDNSAFSKKMVILTSDPSNPSDYLEYVENGGTALIMNSNNDFEGGFSNLLCIKPDNEKPFDGIASTTGEHLTSFGETIGFRPPCSDNVVKSFYVNNGNEVTPFVIETAYGRGKIIFVNVNGYFTTVSKHPAQYFSMLGNITGLIGLNTNHFEDIPPPNVAPFPYFFGGLYMDGPVSIESSSMIFPINYSLLYSESISLETQDHGHIVYNSTSFLNKNYFGVPYMKNLKLYGEYDVIVNGTDLSYSPTLPAFSTYIPLNLSAGSDMTIELSNESKAEFILGPGQVPIQFTGGEIKLKNIRSNLLSGLNLSPSVPVTLKTPEITVHNEAVFLGPVRSNDPDNPTKFTSPWNDFYPKSLQIKGGTILKLYQVAVSDGKYTDGEYVTYFEWIDMDTHANHPRLIPLGEPLEVPWLEFLTSEPNIKLVMSLFVAVSVTLYIGLSSVTVRSRLEGFDNKNQL